MPLHAEEEAQGGRQQGAQHLVPQEKGAAGQVQVMMPSSCDALACIIDLVVWSACLSFSRFFFICFNSRLLVHEFLPTWNVM